MTGSFPVTSWPVVVITVISVSMLRASSAATTSGFRHDGKGIRVNLRRPEQNGGGQNLTRLERVQRAVKRDAERLPGLLASSSSSSSLSTTGVAASERGVMNSSVRSSIPSGAFLMDLSIGTPAVKLSFDMDTGSDVIWTSSSKSESSSTLQIYPCCPVLLHDEGSVIQKLRCVPGNKRVTAPGCAYNSTYGDGSWSWGHIAAESFTFESGSVTVESVTFLSANTTGGVFPGNSSGIVGLGRGQMSLVSQLNVSQFSYCLTDIGSDSVSTLTLGGSGDSQMKRADDGRSVITARLLESPQKDPYSSFYYVKITGISVGDVLLNVHEEVFQVGGDDGGGMIIDSGTTLTYLPLRAFEAVKEEATRQLSANVEFAYALQLSIHFDNATLTVPSENWLYVDSINEDVSFLLGAIRNGSVPGILGNLVQQDMMVTYDLAHASLSFEPKRCG